MNKNKSNVFYFKIRCIQDLIFDGENFIAFKDIIVNNIKIYNHKLDENQIINQLTQGVYWALSRKPKQLAHHIPLLPAYTIQTHIIEIGADCSQSSPSPAILRAMLS